MINIMKHKARLIGLIIVVGDTNTNVMYFVVSWKLIVKTRQRINVSDVVVQ